MGEISIGGKSVSEWTDQELTDWANEIIKSNGKYRLREDTASIWIAVFRAFDEAGPPMSVRQVFYNLETNGIVPKTDNGYITVDKQLLRMRRENIIPYSFIADNTRWMRKPKSYESVEDFLRISQQAYRKMLWKDQNAYVEIWCEKEALAGVIGEITSEWDVPLMITRGFPSETFVYEAAQEIKSQTKPAHLYYFGDHDPSGKKIPENTQDKLRTFGADFHFEQVAIQKWQIEKWNLPTRPTKETDTRAKNWQGGSVELDALPVKILRQMVRECIEQHIDYEALEKSRHVEQLEKQTLTNILNNWGLVSNFA